MDRIAFCIIASNSFFTLGIRFLNKFNHFYRGELDVIFYFFSDVDPEPYIPDGMNVVYKLIEHDDWRAGVNSKPYYLQSLLEENESTKAFSHLYYVDADTNIVNFFDESWFHGELVGLEHFMNHQFIKPEDFPFDRNSKSSCYIPVNSENDNLYYHASFYGGRAGNMKLLCEVLIEQHAKNMQINHEPPWNDESLLNFCFHYSPPFKTIKTKNIQFLISDKGGIEDIRNPELDLEEQKALIRENKNKLFEIFQGTVKVRE